MKQRMLSLMLLLALCVGVLPTAVQATGTSNTTGSGTVEASAMYASKVGWVKNATGWRYRKADGTYIKKAWKTISGKKYYFDAKGYMVTGWTKISGKWYYFNTKGVMQTGWKQLSGKWYYLNTNGIMQTGWKKLSGQWYYLLSNGIMVADQSKTIGGKTYAFDSSGRMLNDSSSGGSSGGSSGSYSSGTTVYVSNSGKTHLKSSCSGMKNYTQMTLGQADAKGYSHCQKCF